MSDLVDSKKTLILPNFESSNDMPEIIDLTLDTSEEEEEEEEEEDLMDVSGQYSEDDIQMSTEQDPLEDVTVIKVVIEADSDNETVTMVTEGGGELVGDDPETESRFCMHSRMEPQSVCDNGSKQDTHSLELLEGQVQDGTSGSCEMNMPVLCNEMDYCASTKSSPGHDMPVLAVSGLIMDSPKLQSGANHTELSIKPSDQSNTSENTFGEQTKLIWNEEYRKVHQVQQEGISAGSDATTPRKMKFTEMMSWKSGYPGSDQSVSKVHVVGIPQQNTMKEQRDKSKDSDAKTKPMKKRKLCKMISNSPQPERCVSKGTGSETDKHTQQNSQEEQEDKSIESDAEPKQTKKQKFTKMFPRNSPHPGRVVLKGHGSETHHQWNNMEELRDKSIQSEPETRQMKGPTETHEHTQQMEMYPDQRKFKYLSEASALSEVTCPPLSVLAVNKPVRHYMTFGAAYYENQQEAADVQDIGYFCDKCAILFACGSHYRAHLTYEGQCSQSSDGPTNQASCLGSGSVVQTMEDQKTFTNPDSGNRVSVGYRDDDDDDDDPDSGNRVSVGYRNDDDDDDDDDVQCNKVDSVLDGLGECLSEGRTRAVCPDSGDYSGTVLSIQVLQARGASAESTPDEVSSSKLVGRISGGTARVSTTSYGVRSGRCDEEWNTEAQMFPTARSPLGPSATSRPAATSCAPSRTAAINTATLSAAATDSATSRPAATSCAPSRTAAINTATSSASATNSATSSAAATSCAPSRTAAINTATSSASATDSATSRPAATSCAPSRTAAINTATSSASATDSATSRPAATSCAPSRTAAINTATSSAAATDSATPSAAATSSAPSRTAAINTATSSASATDSATSRPAATSCAPSRTAAINTATSSASATDSATPSAAATSSAPSRTAAINTATSSTAATSSSPSRTAATSWAPSRTAATNTATSSAAATNSAPSRTVKLSTARTFDGRNAQKTDGGKSKASHRMKRKGRKKTFLTSTPTKVPSCSVDSKDSDDFETFLRKHSSHTTWKGENVWAKRKNMRKKGRGSSYASACHQTPGMTGNDHSSHPASKPLLDSKSSVKHGNKPMDSSSSKEACQKSTDNSSKTGLYSQTPEPENNKTYGQQAFKSAKKLSANDKVLRSNKTLRKRGRKKGETTQVLPEAEVEERKYPLRSKTQASCTGTRQIAAGGDKKYPALSCTHGIGTSKYVMEQEKHLPPHHTMFYVCGSKCGYASLFYRSFKLHVEECLLFGSMSCVHCGFTGIALEDLTGHMEAHLAQYEKMFRCTEKSCVFSTDLLKLLKTHLVDGHRELSSYSCSVCQTVCEDLGSLVHHLEENLMQVAWCKYCDAIACDAEVIQEHEQESHPSKQGLLWTMDRLLCDDRKRYRALETESGISAFGPSRFSLSPGRMVEEDVCGSDDPTVKDVRTGETTENFNLDSTYAGEAQACINRELLHDELSTGSSGLADGDADIFKNNIAAPQSKDEEDFDEFHNDFEKSDSNSELGDNSSCDMADLDWILSVLQSTVESETSTEANFSRAAESETSTEANCAAESETSTVANYSRAAESETSTEANYSHAAESETSTVANYSRAAESETSTEANYSHAAESKTSTVANYSHSAESETSTEANYSHAAESETSTEANYSHAAESETSTEANYSHAAESETSTEANYSHAAESETSTEANYSHAAESETSTEANYSHAAESETSTVANYSRAAESETEANKDLACEDDTSDPSGSIGKNSFDPIGKNKQRNTRKTMTIPDVKYFTKTLECISCVFSSMSRNNFERHLRSCHPEIQIVAGSSSSRSFKESKQCEKDVEDVLDEVLLWLYENHDSYYACSICKRVICVKMVLYCHLLGHLKVNLGHCMVCDEITCLRPEHRKSIILRTPWYIVEETRRSVQALLGSVEENGVLVCDLKPILGTEELCQKLDHLSTFCKNRFYCSVCLSYHISLYSIHKHILLKHLNMPPFSCGACDFCGSERYEVAQHMRSKHPLEPLCLRYSPVDDSRHILFDVPGKRLHRKEYVVVRPDGTHKTSTNRSGKQIRCKSTIIRKKDSGLHRRVGVASCYRTRQGRTKEDSGKDKDVSEEHQCLQCSFRTRLLKLLIEHNKERHPLVEMDKDAEKYQKETGAWCGKMEVELLEAGCKSSEEGDGDAIVKTFYKCQTCNFRSENSDESIKHLRSKMPVKLIIQCSHCTAAFGHFDTFTRHVDLCHKQQNYKYIHIPLEAMVEEVGLLQTKVKAYRCVFCAYRSVMRARFETHLVCHVSCNIGNFCRSTNI